jgi:hypothetical protein
MENSAVRCAFKQKDSPKGIYFYLAVYRNVSVIRSIMLSKCGSALRGFASRNLKIHFLSPPSPEDLQFKL